MITIKTLNYSIRQRTILQDITLRVAQGSFCALVGPNGAGKSTLVKILIGIIKNYSGQILIEEERHKVWLKKNLIGYLPQSETARTDFPVTAKEIVLMGAAGKTGIFKTFNKKTKDKADECLDLVGIKAKGAQLISTLSGGEFQRVLLARALITDSKLLLLDEPESYIDKEGVKDFFKILKDLHKKGKTIILISHDLHIINDYCTDVICLNKNLHCHSEIELLNAEVIKKTYGPAIKLLEKDY